jgi:hypothetical protein
MRRADRSSISLITCSLGGKRTSCFLFYGSILMFGPCGAFLRPGHVDVTPTRAAAVKTGSKSRRRLSLDGGEHGGSLDVVGAHAGGAIGR